MRRDASASALDEIPPSPLRLFYHSSQPDLGGYVGLPGRKPRATRSHRCGASRCVSQPAASWKRAGNQLAENNPRRFAPAAGGSSRDNVDALERRVKHVHLLEYLVELRRRRTLALLVGLADALLVVAESAPSCIHCSSASNRSRISNRKTAIPHSTHA